MSEFPEHNFELPPEQQAIRAKCVHPTGTFVEFKREEIEQSIPERFEKIVCQYRNRLAVKAGYRSLTYDELNQAANCIAWAVLEKCGPGHDPIALLFEHSIDLVPAILAALKAGKIFVALEPSLPVERIESILQDSRPTLILTNSQSNGIANQLQLSSPQILNIDALENPACSTDPGLALSPQAIAYLIYTSGSTGQPKGVVQNHVNLLNEIKSYTNGFHITADDRMTLLTSCGSGQGLKNAFSALLNGAAIYPVDIKSEGAAHLANFLTQEQITVYHSGVGVFRYFVRTLTGQHGFSDLRLIRLASQQVLKEDVESYKQYFSSRCVLVNALSSTETGTIRWHFINKDSVVTDSTVPVGYGLEDKEVVLLDDNDREVGVNQLGEIVVKSRYVSPGYWNRPDLTESKFRPDPAGGENHLYFTGDLGLMLPDRCLIYMGRKDFRVKIRGYGVEIAEIEKVLNTHAAVGQGVVVAREKESGEARLVAYYTCTALPTPTVSELRGFLRKQLPDFMIPSTFVMLDAIPLTHSGKVDRRAFPDPDNVRPTLATQYLSSRNEIEQNLVAIWEEVLDVCPVGVNDGFFDLGGDSLSATRVISQVIKHFQLEVPLQVMFQSPTISDMASVVAQRRGKLSENDKPDQVAASFLVRLSREGLLPLSYSQQRLWFLDQLDPGSFTYNLFSAYRFKGELNVTALEQSFNEIIRHHEVLRTVFKSEGGNPTQNVLPALAIKIPVFDLRGTVSEKDRWTEVRRMSKEEAQRPFDLATGPLLRITVLQLADDEYLLLRAMHHIVSDGWSEGVLFHELSEIYEALANGKPSPLADLPVQYADYAVWQRQWFQGEGLTSQLSYWKKQLQNIATLQLLTDRPRRAIQTSRGARQYFALSHALFSELKELSNQHGVTLFMTLLAAFQTLLHRYSGQTDIVIGSPVAGRSRREFEELIGFFLNMLVLRTDLSGDLTFVEVMTRVRDVCLAALSHQELPFEKLVEELNPDHNLAARGESRE